MMADPLLAQDMTRVVVSVSAARGQTPLQATVVLTIAPTAESLVAQADASGTASIAVAGAQRTGEYIVSATALGYRTARQRIVVPSADTVFAVRFALVSDTNQIATVRVQATVPRAQRNFGVDPSVADGQNRRPDGVVNVVDPSQQGTLEALAASLPGLTRAEGSVAAFGLGAAGTGVTLNGMQQGISTIPRDLAVATTVMTSPWDATRGAFSGALVSHTIQSGTSISRRRGRVALSGRYTELGQAQLALGDRLGYNAALSLGGSGSWLPDRGFYNYGIQYTEQSYQSLAIADASARELGRLGLSIDTVRAVRDALVEQAVPHANSLTVGGRVARLFTFMQRLDLNAREVRGAGPPRGLSLVYGGGVGRTGGIGASMANMASTASTFSTTNAFAQLTHAINTGAQDQVAHQTTLATHIQRDRLSPASVGPSGILRTTSMLDDARLVTSQIQFGGSSIVPERNQHRSVDLVHQTSWLVRGKTSLPAKVMAQVRIDDGWTDATAASAGQFEYPTTEAFRQRNPSAYNRTLSGTRVATRVATSALAASTSWETRRLSLIGGVRADAARELGGASSADATDRESGPLSLLAMSPRLGFTFYPKAQRGPALYSNAVSSSYRTGPHFRGGIGVFRAAPRFMEVLRQSGGEGEGQLTTGIRCVGDAIPNHTWGDAGAGLTPVACDPANGTWSERWSAQRFLARGYQPSEAIRSNLGWTATLAGHYLALDVTRSDNRHLAGAFDARYPTEPIFQLADEGSRPVFVDASSIDPNSGQIVRPPNLTGQTTTSERYLDASLRGRVHSASVFLIPQIPLRFGQVSLAYVASQARRQYRGFDGATAGSAMDQEWADDARTPRHVFVVQGARLFRRGDVGVSFSSRIASGERFSPLVGGDINGDGLMGDRAFVPGPASTAEAVLHQSISRLAQNSAANIRKCIENSFGSVASRNTCSGPWTVSSHLAVVVTRWPGLSQRAQVTLNVSNPLSIVLPSGNSARIVSGSVATVDQTLLRVDGFRREDARFTYRLNENFGRTLSAIGTRDPLRFTVDVRLDLAPSADLQRLKLSLRAATGREGRVSTDSIMARYRQNVFAGMYTSLIRLGDSLALSRAQLEAFQERDTFVRARIDSVYRELAQHLSAPERRADLRAETKRAIAADDAAWQVIYDESAVLQRILSPGQIRKLPSSARALVTVKGFRARFFF
ncbi:MAG: carboxypeptidase regulatory-like domain-containing protein [Gemmatimonadaceae bacterium]|nr:carboxypeptidase regulatory-like domain-containing protein [Gemmatimonadaceae bacterium]